MCEALLGPTWVRFSEGFYGFNEDRFRLRLLRPYSSRSIVLSANSRLFSNALLNTASNDFKHRVATADMMEVKRGFQLCLRRNTKSDYLTSYEALDEWTLHFILPRRFVIFSIPQCSQPFRKTSFLLTSIPDRPSHVICFKKAKHEINKLEHCDNSVSVWVLYKAIESICLLCTVGLDSE